MRLPMLAVACLIALPVGADDGNRVLTLDHFVRVRSTVPSLNGQDAQIYVRERVQPKTVLRGGPAADRVVLFVHGSGTPAEVAFDVPYRDYSWMAYLAAAGFDVFSMDMTGYGQSTRPPAMNDPCNLSANQQATFVPGLIAAPCAAGYPHPLTTIASDWNDLDAVVNYLCGLRRVERLNLVGWSLGAPRAGGYAAQHPDKVLKLVLLAPAYGRGSSAGPPAQIPAAGTAMNTQSRQEFFANWDRQAGCADQYDKDAAESVWSEMLASDPVGSTWGAGVRRAPQVTTWGWNRAVVSQLQTPTLLVTGANDKQVAPERVKELFADLGGRQKILVDLACSSHNAMWERNRVALFDASVEWLLRTSVNGNTEGTVRIGY